MIASLSVTEAEAQRRGPRGSSMINIVGFLSLLWISLLVSRASAISNQPSEGVFATADGESTFPSLIDATIEDLQYGLTSGHFTSLDLVKAYIARIAEVNETVHAVIEVNLDALAIASQLDEERQNGPTRGALHGIPILLKANIATLDGMQTTSGSWALVGARVSADAKVAEKLRRAGAILLGKTNLSEWANFRSTGGNSTNGWSAWGGQVYAAYHRLQDPEGSSSGSGVASDLGLAAACIGTETDGSIMWPAARSNIVGITPTVGLTSRAGVIPISEHQDTIGPMARTVKDAASILQAITGIDDNDNYTLAAPTTQIDYVAACDMSALQGSRIGIARNVMTLQEDKNSGPQIAALDAAITLLEEAGATVVDKTDFPGAADFVASNRSSEMQVLFADFISNLATYLAGLTANPNNISSLSALRDWTRTSLLEAYPNRDTGRWDAALDSQGWNNTDPRFWPAYEKNIYYGNDGGLLGTLEKHDLDAVILPTRFALGWAAVVGAPVVTVPLGYYPDDAEVVMDERGDLVHVGPGVPFGLSFLGKKWTEAKLIGLAYAFEQKTKVRQQGHKMRYVVPRTELADVVVADVHVTDTSVVNGPPAHEL